MIKVKFIQCPVNGCIKINEEGCNTCPVYQAYERGKEERPTGEWYYSIDRGWHCSECDEVVKDMPTCMRKATYKYCPNCGAKMMKEAENDK